MYTYITFRFMWVKLTRVNGRQTQRALSNLLLLTPTSDSPTRSAWVAIGCARPSVCLSVCPQHNSKKNDHKVFKLVVGNDRGTS